MSLSNQQPGESAANTAYDFLTQHPKFVNKLNKYSYFYRWEDDKHTYNAYINVPPSEKEAVIDVLWIETGTEGLWNFWKHYYDIEYPDAIADLCRKAKTVHREMQKVRNLLKE